MATIQGVYVALFGRPADPIGLSFFSQATNNGANLTAIGDLTTTNEYKLRFEGQSSTQIINSIYRSLFNRDADLAGLTFFANALAAGRLNINNIAIAIFDGAQGSDITIRDLKVNAANAFTAQIDTSAEVLGYTGIAAAQSAAAFLATVTTTAPTAAQITAAVAAATSQTPVNATFNLTTTVGETITGTGGNDVINGVLDAAAPAANTGTFNTGDIVNGGNGTDTLNLIVTTGGALPAGATVSGVEIVNINQTTAALTGLSSAQFAGVQQLWQIDTAAGGGTFQNVTVGADVTAGFRGAGQVVAQTVTGAANAATVSVALDGVLTASTVTIAETTAGATKTVNLSGSASTAASTLNLDAGGSTTAVETINIGLTSSATVNLTHDVGVTKTVSLANSTAGVTLDLTTATALTTFTGGSGADVLTASNANLTSTTGFVLNAGAGADTINFDQSFTVGSNGTHTLTGGAGGDTFNFTGTGNLRAVATNADLLANITIISDFTAAEDVINANFGPRTTQNTVTNAVTAAAPTDLRGAVVAAANVTAVGDGAVFEFGGNTYLYGEDAVDGLSAGDYLVQLTGVSVSSLTAANFTMV